MASINTTLKKSDLQEGKPVKVDANGKAVMIVMIKGEVYAIENTCSHRGGPLNEGLLKDYIIQCPWHGARYDVRTGKVDPNTSWGKMQTKYSVKVEQSGQITLEL